LGEILKTLLKVTVITFAFSCSFLGPFKALAQTASFHDQTNHAAAIDQATGHDTFGETIVLVRHGEKTEQELGQLSCKGFNRALALPSVLITRYGKPDFIFAPNPSIQNHLPYSYVRPLATIEPTAIQAEKPVNTQIGFNDIATLQNELMRPAYARSVVFVAWEHVYLYEFARQMLSSNGQDSNVVPEWPSDDYDTIYVIQISRPKGKPEISFSRAKEMLEGSLSDKCGGAR
jgi:hypothetical protein